MPLPPIDGSIAQLAPRIANLRNDRKGAVYVEFLIAFLPIFCMFMALVQLAFIQVANVVTKHAAVMAARAAVVVLPDDDKYYGDRSPRYRAEGKRLEAIEEAAKGVLRSVSTLPMIKLTFPTNEGGDDNKSQFAHDDLVRVQLKFYYPCKIPKFVSWFMCGFGGRKVLKAESVLPMQGATYDY